MSKRMNTKRRGHYDGKHGGYARANALTPERRREIAVKAAAKRWQDKPKVRTNDTSDPSR